MRYVDNRIGLSCACATLIIELDCPVSYVNNGTSGKIVPGIVCKLSLLHNKSIKYNIVGPEYFNFEGIKLGLVINQ